MGLQGFEWSSPCLSFRLYSLSLFTGFRLSQTLRYFCFFLVSTQVFPLFPEHWNISFFEALLHVSTVHLSSFSPVVTTFPFTFLFVPLAGFFFFLMRFYIYSKETFPPLVASILLVKYCAIFPHLFLVNILEPLKYILMLVVFDFTMEG